MNQLAAHGPRGPGSILLAAMCGSLLLAVGLLAGCSQPTIPNSYGAIQYPERDFSTNGLGVFQRLCTQSGLRVTNVSRLSPRLRRVDCLILVGSSFHPPAKEVRDWIEQWLADQPGRTVIYFGRDFTADRYIYRKTLAEQPAERVSRAEFDLARSQSELDRKFYAQLEGDIFCRWFTLRTSQPARTLTKFTGPLSHLMGEDASWSVRAYLDTVDPELENTPPAWRTTIMMPVLRFPTFRQRANKPGDDKPTVFTSFWSYTDINDDETWAAEWDQVSQAEVLLSGEDGTPLVTQLTNERFPDSQIILLANGAPLFNGMLVEPHFMKLANHLVSELDSGSRLAFLPFDESGIQVSEVPDDEDQMAGLSVLVTWPLNILMAHLALLGVLICLALFPIYGRPQSLPSPSTSDFGQHAVALGQLLSKAADIQFAAQLSADYLRVVRGESVPDWLQSATNSSSQPSGQSVSNPLTSPVVPPSAPKPSVSPKEP